MNYVKADHQNCRQSSKTVIFQPFLGHGMGKKLCMPKKMFTVGHSDVKMLHSITAWGEKTRSLSQNVVLYTNSLRKFTAFSCQAKWICTYTMPGGNSYQNRGVANSSTTGFKFIGYQHWSPKISVFSQSASSADMLEISVSDEDITLTMDNLMNQFGCEKYLADLGPDDILPVI